jgi:hypothetical protein
VLRRILILSPLQPTVPRGRRLISYLCRLCCRVGNVVARVLVVCAQAIGAHFSSTQCTIWTYGTTTLCGRPASRSANSSSSMRRTAATKVRPPPPDRHLPRPPHSHTSPVSSTHISAVISVSLHRLADRRLHRDGVYCVPSSPLRDRHRAQICSAGTVMAWPVSDWRPSVRVSTVIRLTRSRCSQHSLGRSRASLILRATAPTTATTFSHLCAH